MLHAVFLYVNIVSIFKDGVDDCGYSYGSRLAASTTVAQAVKVSERTVRRWVSEYETLEYISKSVRGKHSKVDCPIMTNLDLREKFKAHVREASRPKGRLQ